VPTRDEKTWDRRKLHKEELSDLYSSPNIALFITEKYKMEGICGKYGGE
jgi:hypothetical protein